MENALGVEISEQTLLLRKLAFVGETLQSHYLHAFYLVAPDLPGRAKRAAAGADPPGCGQDGVAAQAHGQRHLLQGGRRRHPPVCHEGQSLPKVPKAEDLLALKQRLVDSVPDLHATVALLKTLSLPQFERTWSSSPCTIRTSTRCIAGPSSTRPRTRHTHPDYKKQVKEYVVPHSHAKHVASGLRGVHGRGAGAVQHQP